MLACRVCLARWWAGWAAAPTAAGCLRARPPRSSCRYWWVAGTAMAAVGSNISGSSLVCCCWLGPGLHCPEARSTPGRARPRAGLPTALPACLPACLSALKTTLYCLLLLQARAGERMTGSASVHGPGEYWRVLRQASELAAIGALPALLPLLLAGAVAPLSGNPHCLLGGCLLGCQNSRKACPLYVASLIDVQAFTSHTPACTLGLPACPSAESGHERTDYLRAAPRSEEERQAQRKAARLSLDTSGGRCKECGRTRRQVAAETAVPAETSCTVANKQALAAHTACLRLSAPAPAPAPLPCPCPLQPTAATSSSAC